MADIKNEYLVRRGTQAFATISSLFDGVRVLKIDGYTNKGKPVNIYTAQWVDKQNEDYMITTTQTIDDVDYDVVIRENVDLDITFIVGDKYATGVLNVRQQHDAFIAYMTDGALYIKSNYADRTMKCVCLKDYKPTIEKLKRPAGKNYIMGTISLHTLDVQAGDGDGYISNPYPTTGGDTPTPAPTQTINAANVYDATIGATQASINQTMVTFRAGAFTSATYSSVNKRITFANADGTIVGTLDVSDFVKDGMVSNVEVVGGNLVITFNTDAGKTPITIPISSIFNADNYYNKTQSDNRFLNKANKPTISVRGHTLVLSNNN